MEGFDIIGLVMIVKNEEKTLARCLESAKPYVDQMVVVDTGSTDKTKAIATKYGAQVHDFKWTDDFSKARNFGLDQSNCEWNLILDADEQIVCWDTERINEHMKKSEKNGRITIVNSFRGNDGEITSFKEKITRFLTKETRYEGMIHEQVNSERERIDLPIEVFHDGYLDKDKSERNIPLLRKSLEKNKNDKYLQYQLAKEYKQKKKYDQADIYFTKCYLQLDRTEAYYPLVVVDFIYNSIAYKNYEHGHSVIGQEQQVLKNYPDFWLASGLFYTHYASLENKYFSFVEQCFANALAVGETNAYPCVKGTGTYLAAYNLGLFYEHTFRKEKAIEMYQICEKYNYTKGKNRLLMLNK